MKLWLDLLPEDMIRENPVLLLFKAQLMPNSRQLEMVEPLKRLLHQSLLINNIQGYYDVASVLIYILMCSNDMKGLREITEDLPRELENTLSILDMVRLIGKERFSEAAEKRESIAYALLRRLWSIDRSASAPDLADALKELSLIRKASPGLMVYESSLSIIGAIAREYETLEGLQIRRNDALELDITVDKSLTEALRIPKP